MPEFEMDRRLAIPLRVDETGAVRVGDTRVSLLSVLTAFHQGDTPERIAQSFPALELSAVYAVLAYYLANRDEIDAWLAEERAAGERIEHEAEAEFPPAGIRDRLLRRKVERQSDAP